MVQTKPKRNGDGATKIPPQARFPTSRLGNTTKSDSQSPCLRTSTNTTRARLSPLIYCDLLPILLLSTMFILECDIFVDAMARIPLDPRFYYGAT